MSDMPDLTSVTTFIQLLSGFLVSITAFFAAIIGIFKPLRTWFGKMIDKFKNTEINTRLDSLETTVESMNSVMTSWKADMQVKFDKDSAEQSLLKEANIASLRNDITELYYKADSQGYIGEYDLKNWISMVEVYTALGGNHYVAELNERVLEMPTTPSKRKSVKTTKKKKK